MWLIRSSALGVGWSMGWLASSGILSTCVACGLLPGSAWWGCSIPVSLIATPRGRATHTTHRNTFSLTLTHTPHLYLQTHAHKQSSRVGKWNPSFEAEGINSVCVLISSLLQEPSGPPPYKWAHPVRVFSKWEREQICISCSGTENIEFDSSELDNLEFRLWLWVC